jgi:hypothetical protein
MSHIIERHQRSARRFAASLHPCAFAPPHDALNSAAIAHPFASVQRAIMNHTANPSASRAGDVYDLRAVAVTAKSSHQHAVSRAVNWLVERGVLEWMTLTGTNSCRTTAGKARSGTSALGRQLIGFRANIVQTCQEEPTEPRGNAVGSSL